MEPAGGIMEGGEWSSFNGVYVNEEADFMAQLFPTHSSVVTDNAVDGSSGLACWSNDLNMATGSIYSSSDAANTNLYSSFSQDTYSGGSCITNYPTAGHENYYLCDNYHTFLAANNNNAMLVEFREDKADGDEDCLNPEMEESGEVEHADTKHLFPTRESMSTEVEDKDSDHPDVSRKRARASDAPTRKRNATKSKKRQKASLVDDDNNNGGLNRQSSSGCSSEDESNLSLELHNGASSSSARNLNGKTRASRGSATDPQSLYARKRRERINERLRVLQNLVPNGTKVDISTMLEEAVQYVKFLQLQIKLLSSDDLWMYAPIAYNGMDIGLDLKR